MCEHFQKRWVTSAQGFTLSTYVHSTPGMKQSAADAIGNTIRNAI